MSEGGGAGAGSGAATGPPGQNGPDIPPASYQSVGSAPAPATYSNPPSQPPTPSSTVQDPPSYRSVEDAPNESKTNVHGNGAVPGVGGNSGGPGSNLPPFSSFSAADVNEGLGGRLAGDGYLTTDGGITSTRVMELSGWDYCYTDGRYLERGDSMPVMIPQPQYRPWESKQDGSADGGKSTLPSFQSQFGEELVTTLTTLTPAAACSPAPSVQSPGLPSFHTLSAVNPARYPLVPAPVQAREIPSIQQQFLDERHIHLFQGPTPGQNFALQPQNGLNGPQTIGLNNGTTTLTTLNNAQYHPQIINNAQILPSGQIIAPQSHHLLAPTSQIITSNGHIISSSGGQALTVVSQNSTPTVLTVVKAEPVNIVELKSNSNSSNLTHLHHANFQNPLITQGQQMDPKFGLESPPRGVDGRKKERRKIRASSLESSNESDGAMSVESSGQVAAVSSTAGFKSPMTPGQIANEGDGMMADGGEKQTKKKRKRCGECIGCQRKDNCGDCAPCRNDKSHQICKMRRCEKLTEKKHLLAYNREDGGVSYRGRGRGRGRGSRGGCRGKSSRPSSHSAQATPPVNEMNSTPGLAVGSGRESVKMESGRASSGPISTNPNLTPTMAVPFYAGTEVWPTSTPSDPWTAQGQFIHQIDDIRYQHYPGYQTTGYQQSGFITDQTSAFQPQYSSNSSNGGNPSTSPAHGSVTPRSTGSYNAQQVHTPTASPNPSSTPHVNGHRNGLNVHYIEETYVNGTAYSGDTSSMVPPASTTPSSRSSSGQMDTGETTTTTATTKTTNYMSGNEIPGYPLNSPQCQSSCNSSGYPGQSLQEYGDQSANDPPYQVNHSNQKSPSYAQPSPGTYQTYPTYEQQQQQQQSQQQSHQKSPKPGMSPGSSCHPSQKQSGMYPQSSPNSNPSPQNYQQISPRQYDGRTPNQQSYYPTDGYPGQSPQSYDAYASQNMQNQQQDKTSVNARIKSMIMNKQQQQQQQQQSRPNSNYSASNDNHIMSPPPSREMMSPAGMGNQMPAASPKDHTAAKNSGQVTDGTNHFLAFSHHLRDGSVLQPEGGGVDCWADPMIGPDGIKRERRRSDNGRGSVSSAAAVVASGPMPTDSLSAMENFMRFASAEFDRGGLYNNLDADRKMSQSEFQQRLVMYETDPIRNLEANFPTTKRDVVDPLARLRRTCTFSGCPRRNCGGYGLDHHQQYRQRPAPKFMNNNYYCYGPNEYYPTMPPESCYPIGGVKSEVDRSMACAASAGTPVGDPAPWNIKTEVGLIEDTPSPYQRISYAPSARNMEVIDLRFVKTEPGQKEKWEEYRRAMEKEREGEEEVKKEGGYLFEGDGGPIALEKSTGAWCCRLGGIETPSPEHLRDGCCQGLQTADELPPAEKEKAAAAAAASTDGTEKAADAGTPVTSQPAESPSITSPGQETGQEGGERLKSCRSDVPDCQCFPPDKYPPEPGSYYTHLGAAATLADLRQDLETRTGQSGKGVRIEKICYTGKEGKTTQGCPLAKWVIRRSCLDEKFLIVVKHRQGHTCSTAWIVVCMVAWEGVPSAEADRVYNVLTHKLNRFGLPTTRRCATNEPRTCACQGLDPDTCGASFSFGCSWSMYYNGCKYARSKTVRKFRLSVRSEEQEVEERMHVLATLLSPLYNTLAPEAFANQTMCEREASECRLGFKPGRPFSGVTACIDFCAHSHRDLHNMNNGCTVVVSLTKHRSLSKPDDEQLHVLPLYIMDETDENGSKESQEAKYRDGSIECLKKFPCEVRVRAVPLQPCRRHGKKRKDEDVDAVIPSAKPIHLKNTSPILAGNAGSPMHCVDVAGMMEGMDGQLQSSQVSSTVMDSPVGMYQGWNYHGLPDGDAYGADGQWGKPWERKQGWQWDYAGYDRDVDPDSTTTQSQICSPNSNLLVGSAGSGSTWSAQHHQQQQLADQERKRRTGKNWSDPADVFRIPRGRPPSRPTHLPTSTDSDGGNGTSGCGGGGVGGDTFLKPYPRDKIDNHATSIHNSTKDESDAGSLRQQWLGRAAETSSSSSSSVSFNQTPPGGFDPTGYHQYQKSGYPNYGGYMQSAYNPYSQGGWSDFLEPRYDGYGYNQGFPLSTRWGPHPPPHHPHRWDLYGAPPPFFPLVPEAPKSEPIGEVTDFVDNEECFKDSQMGGVAIALGHGSVLFECAKHELHATTALRRPNRLQPTRISLVFYQHRNLNRAKHGWDEWEEKMRLRKLGIGVAPEKGSSSGSSRDLGMGGKGSEDSATADAIKLAGLDKPLGLGERILIRVPTYTTTTWTTLFPMRPCMVTGPYQEGGND